MDLFGVFEISAAGMSVEQTKLAVASSNLANMRTVSAEGGTPYQPLAVSVRSQTVIHDAFAAAEASVRAEALPRPMVTHVAPVASAPRLVYDPGHPDADQRGFVAQPAIDTVSTMLELMSISRSYEANLKAFDITRHLVQRTLEMGGRR